jgi:hypothetical protein
VPVNPSVKTCTHVKVTGHPCGSPALSGERFCYFHQRMIRGVRTPPKSRIHPMALIENEEGIQVALMETINAIARNQIDLQRANLILRALSIAVRNSRRVRFDRCESEMVRAIPDYQPATAASEKSEAAQTISGIAQRRNSLAPHGSAEKALSNGASPADPAPDTAQAPLPRKPPAPATSAPVAQAQAANARPLRE